MFWIALSFRPSATHLILFILSINKSGLYFSNINLYNQWLHRSWTKSNIIENQIFVWNKYQDYVYVYYFHIAQYNHSRITFHCVKISQWLSYNFISKVRIKGRPLITFKFEWSYNHITIKLSFRLFSSPYLPYISPIWCFWNLFKYSILGRTQFQCCLSSNDVYDITLNTLFFNRFSIRIKLARTYKLHRAVETWS